MRHVAFIVCDRAKLTKLTYVAQKIHEMTYVPKKFTELTYFCRAILRGAASHVAAPCAMALPPCQRGVVGP